MRSRASICFFLALIGCLLGCPAGVDHSQGVYLLLDTSGPHAAEMKKARIVINSLLEVLQPGDTLIVSRIDTGNFSKKNMIAKARFDQRPSLANAQKRSFQKNIEAFVSSSNDKNSADLSGGILQAIESLNEAGVGRKSILIFSDLEEEQAKGDLLDVPFPLNGFQVVALNVTQLRDKEDPKKYLARVEEWRRKTEKGGGRWRVINDFDHLDSILEP